MRVPPPQGAAGGLGGGGGRCGGGESHGRGGGAAAAGRARGVLHLRARTYRTPPLLAWLGFNQWTAWDEEIWVGLGSGCGASW